MIFDAPEPIDYSRYRELKLSLDDGIMTVTLSNPGKRNAVTMRMAEELSMIWEDIWADTNIKAAILTGEGGDFCAGADISQLSQASSPDAAAPVSYVHRATRHGRKHVMGIIECEKPVIAKVRGVAYGMGVSMALACDMVFVSDTARICDSHVKVGLVAGDGGVLLWPLAVGMHRAKEYLMTGEPLSGKLAEEIGLVNRCLPDAELDQHVDSMIAKLVSLPPHAVNYTKVAMNQAMKQMSYGAFETSLAYEVYTMGMDDVEEAARAFLEKRKGQYTGN